MLVQSQLTMVAGQSAETKQEVAGWEQQTAKQLKNKAD